MSGIMKVGDFCFARVRGYPAWPAKILTVLDSRPATMKYEVLFCDSRQTAAVLAKEVFAYDENKEKFCAKQGRRKNFMEGIAKLEEERAKMNGNGEVEPETSKTEEPRPTPKRRRTSDVSEVTQSQPPKKNRRASAAVEVKTETPTPQKSSEEQVTSRSGRLKKPKKFFDDKEDNKDTEPKEGDVSLVEKSSVSPAKKQKKTKGGEDETIPKFEVPALAAIGRSIWVRAPSGKLALLHVNHEIPASFQDSPETWYRDYEEFLTKTKKSIESGEGIPEVFARQIQLYEEDSIYRAMHWQQAKTRWMKQELRIHKIDNNIRFCLQKTKTNVDKALAYLGELMNTDIDPLMLKKFPNIVWTILTVRNYVGNVPEWNLAPEQVREFHKTVMKIQKKCDLMLNKFRDMFAVGRTDDFKEQFKQRLAEFQTATQAMPVESVVSLMCDPSAEHFEEVQRVEEDLNELCRNELLKPAKEVTSAAAAAAVAIATK